MPDEPYVNPIVYTMLGHVSNSDNFPSEDYAIELYAQLRNLCVDDIVTLILENDVFIMYFDQIKMAIHGMDIKGIGYVVTKFIDSEWPVLMKQLNTSDAEFNLYREVVTKIVEEIRKEPKDDEIDGSLQG